MWQARLSLFFLRVCALFIHNKMKQKNLRGYTVKYKEDASKGVEHLAYVLNIEESESLFHNSRLSGKVKFEDRYARNFTLFFRGNGIFEIKKRGGW